MIVLLWLRTRSTANAVAMRYSVANVVCSLRCTSFATEYTVKPNYSATVAQSVEQLIRNQQVGGSSPPSSSKKVGRKVFWHFDLFLYFKGV